MRPKRVILLVDANEIELSMRAYMLWNAGYSVLRVSSVVDALQVLCFTLPDVLVIHRAIMGGSKLISWAKEIHLPSLSFSREINASNMIADDFLPKSMNNAEMVLEKVKILVARKRGPKPQKASEYAK